MKIKFPIIFAIISVFILTACSKNVEFNGTFSTEPEKPVAGEKVMVKYDPANTVLKNSENIKMFVYQYDIDIKTSSEYEMQKLENGWTAEFIVLPETKGTIIIFAEGETQDNNDEKGYFIKIHDQSGNVLAGFYGGLGTAQYSWGRRVGLAKDIKESIVNFRKEFESNPEIKPEFFDFYFPALIADNELNANGIIKAELEQLEKKEDKNEYDLSVLAEWYNQIGMELKGEEYENLLLKMNPDGKYAEDKLANEIYSESDISKKKELLKKFESQFPESDQINDLYDRVVLAYRNNKEYEAAKKFMHENYGKITPYFYYSIASRWLNENGTLEDVEDFLKEGIKFSEEQVAHTTLPKSKTSTREEFRDELKYYCGMNQFTLAVELNAEGETETALQLLERGVENTFDYYPQQDKNELFIKLLIENGDYDKAVRNLERFIKTGNGSAKQMEMLKEAYVKLHGNEVGFDDYASQFKEAAKQLIVEKLEKEIKKEKAPNFTLTDLSGAKVSLDNFKGKTVILDFWATWCGPCLKSFPGVKKTVEKFKEDESVKFLFVNTWERVENKKQNAEQFIRKNDYPFHVLMDTENQVVADYKVAGIPTKFIIDKEGYIRFQSVGFSGNTDQIVTEISEMIKMIN